MRRTPEFAKRKAKAKAKLAKLAQALREATLAAKEARQAAKAAAKQARATRSATDGKAAASAKKKHERAELKRAKAREDVNSARLQFTMEFVWTEAVLVASPPDDPNGVYVAPLGLGGLQQADMLLSAFIGEAAVAGVCLTFARLDGENQQQFLNRLQAFVSGNSAFVSRVCRAQSCG